MRRTKGMKKVTLVLVSTFMLVLLLGMTTLASEAALKKLKLGTTKEDVKTDRAAFKDYKITVRNRSVISFSGAAYLPTGTYESVRVELLNSKRKKINAVTTTVNVSSSTNTSGLYSVNKGTYYLRVRNSNPFVFAYATARVNENSGTRASNAKNLQRKKARVGIIGAGEKKNAADYYKITLKKARKVNFQVSSRSGSTGVAISISGSRIRTATGWIVTNSVDHQKESMRIVGRGNKLPAGTYYVKVSRARAAKGRDALYSIYWK